MNKRDLARSDYLKGMKYKDIASKYHVSINTVKSWKTRYWNKEQVPRLQPKRKKGAHKSTEGAHKVATKEDNQNDDSDDVNEHGLNSQQEYYCELRSKQYPQFVAYRVAYDSDYKLANATISSKASRLEKNENISARIGKLIKERMNEYKWDNDIAVEKTSELFYLAMESILINGINKSNSDAAYNALDRLDKWVGLGMMSELQKKELQGKVKLLDSKIKNANGSDEQQMNQITKLLDDINCQLD